jgi:hypothetical protein
MHNGIISGTQLFPIVMSLHIQHLEVGAHFVKVVCHVNF